MASEYHFKVETYMKEIRLDAGIHYDFELLGITSSLKDYRLAWHMNDVLQMHLSKVDDHVIEYSEFQKIEVSCFRYEGGESVIRLLSNKVYREADQKQAYLIPEHKHFDFFLLLEGQPIDVTNFTNKLKQINGLEFITKIDVKKLRSKENLIL